MPLLPVRGRRILVRKPHCQQTPLHHRLQAAKGRSDAGAERRRLHASESHLRPQQSWASGVEFPAGLLPLLDRPGFGAADSLHGRELVLRVVSHGRDCKDVARRTVGAARLTWRHFPLSRHGSSGNRLTSHRCQGRHPSRSTARVRVDGVQSVTTCCRPRWRIKAARRSVTSHLSTKPIDIAPAYRRLRLQRRRP